LDQKNLEKNPTIDIIIPVYNSANYIDQTLQSILQQDYKNYKVFIVNDCSSDNLKDKIKKYKNLIKIINLKKNKGPAFCRNLGIRYSKSEYISFLDSDDFWDKYKLSKHIKFMTKYNLDFSYTNYISISENGQIRKKITVQNISNFNQFIKNTSIATSTMIIRRSSMSNLKFKKKGYGFDDYIFKAELLKKKINTQHFNEFLTYYRIRKKSISSNPLRNILWVWKINKNYFNFKFFFNLKSLFFIIINSIKKYYR
tara:strand:- start:1140 stop:1904 length:765 start_codon:yes stop_codon:yes gene_type:complete